MTQNKTTTSDSTGNNTVLAVSGLPEIVCGVITEYYGEKIDNIKQIDGLILDGKDLVEICHAVHEALKAACANGAVEKCVCGDCGEPLTLVRPGKHQCDNELCKSNRA